jgi:ABC-type transport system involved in multi-copper enzyme maturation permease subunit
VVGPLFFYDLLRLARRGRSTLLRCAYALALFATVCIVYQMSFPQHDLLSQPFASPRSVAPGEMARLADGFVRALLAIQTAAIFVLVPAYLASAIAEEKERRTLELLFTTAVTDREIVLGKLASRVLHLGGILLAGLPILALMQLWGGVDFSILLAAFVATGLNLLSIGAICILCSVMARTVTAAVFASYGLSAAASILLVPLAATPVGVFDTLTTEQQGFRVPGTTSFPAPRLVLTTGARIGPRIAPPAPPPPPSPVEAFVYPVVICTAVNGLIIVIMAAAAVIALREAAGLAISSPAPRPVSPKLPQQIPERGWGPFEDPVQPGSRRRPLPPVGDWPLLWKETYSAGENSLTPDIERLAVRCWPVLIILLFLFPLPAVYLYAKLLRDPEALRAVGYFGRIAVLLPAGAWCIVVALRAASGISKERDGRTLEGLLTLPVSRAELLGAKWLGPVLYGRGFGYMFAAVVAAGALSGMLHPLAALLLIAAIAAHVAFLASLGVWLSLTSRTTVWARVTMAMVLLLFLGAGLRVMNTEERSGAYAPPARGYGGLEPQKWRKLVAESGANAPGSWWFLSFSWNEFGRALSSGDRVFAAELGVAAAGTVAYGAVALLFWVVAYQRFRREQTR